MTSLARHDAARHMAWYDCPTVQPHLCGACSLVRAWGRLGTPSQEKSALHAPKQDAQAAMVRTGQQTQRQGEA
jgi:predicted DNA-binding WGR domain protein